MTTDTTTFTQALFLPIPGFPEYEVSDTGIVRNSLTERVTKPNYAHRYVQVNLRRGGKGVSRHVHRLVLLAHVGPPPTPAHHAAHYDGDTTRNVLPNLRWATAKENCADRERHGTTARGDRHGSRTKPESVPRGDRHGSRTKPESVPRGDRHGSRTKPETRPRGDQHGNVKLTEIQVRDIRIDTRNHKDTADAYGVTPENISHIRRRKTWTHAN